MSRQHVMMIAEPSATAFLFGDSDRRWATGAKILRAKQKRGGATSITSTGPKEPADACWADRRAMKRASKTGAINNRAHRGGITSQGDHR